MPSSIAVPLASLNVASVPTLGDGTLPITRSAICAARAPEIRTTPMPPRPGGVATAAIVSRAGSPLGMGRLAAIEQALNLPLLQDGKDVVHQPVEHQAGREEEEKDAEDERHELHHLRLHRVRRRRVHAR